MVRESLKNFWNLYTKASLPVKIGLLIILIWVLTAVFAPLLTEYDPSKADITNSFLPPAFCEGGVREHPLGTDEVGRDIYARLVYGARISLIVAILAGMVSMAIGTVAGMLAGYFGGTVDNLHMRLVDVMNAFPFMFMALCFMVALGSGLGNIVLVLGITGWVPYARTVRAEVLAIRGRDFVVAAEISGCSSNRLIFTHIFPNIIDSAIVIATMQMANTILSEASLTFLGMGLPADIPSWGQMISSGRSYIYTNFWLTLIPGLAIFLVSLSINFVGDWVRDLRDPRLRGATKNSEAE